MTGPGWPDTKGWALVGLFALTGGIFTALAINPALSSNTLFDTLATLVVGSGGLLNALGYFFGSSAGAAKKDETIAVMANTQANSPPPTLPQPQSQEPPE